MSVQELLKDVDLSKLNISGGQEASEARPTPVTPETERAFREAQQKKMEEMAALELPSRNNR